MLEDPFLQTLAAVLERWRRGGSVGFAVAFSGGLDSSVLLTALKFLERGDPLRALHVDHGLHPDSAAWDAHCRAFAARLDAAYTSVRVEVARDARQGLEAAAREARYRALARLLAPGETLLTAHHGDDQLETVLLRVLRGTGVRGLRGIVEFAAFGSGYLARPLLKFSKRDLRAQARRWGLDALEDPANRDPAHDRNLLRLEVLPRLARRWPAAPRTAQRLAEQMADAQQILDEAAAHDAGDLDSRDRVPRAGLAALTSARQRNLLRYLTRALDLGTPTAAQIEGLRAAALDARRDARTLLRWPGGEARVYRDGLYLLRPLPPGSGADFNAMLVTDGCWSGPEGDLRFAPSDGPGLPQSWLDSGLSLRFRAGGERFRPFGRAHSVSLKHWLQDAGIVPWMRGRVPLLYRGGELVAVADLALDDAARTAPAEPRRRVVWSNHPAIR